ncbi:MAG: TPM domain-containing protein [Sporocytophaga sp.]|uniref:TPM domain-containing protein n=1 Tax=Sporocytophaga sp. TaxID=2231183 RepID=UPI001B20BC00|nr:TPM domain-containing protein [Sporocytophaga sp.]MBO9701910.1 TPM domain-containing protein [Sporocytophaga sp.]
MAKSFFSEQEQAAIVSAIKEAEKNTSGEIQVHLESHCKEDVLDRAVDVFKILKMHETKLRNGVLFYLAIKDKKFAILGDAGINSKVSDHFWDDIKVMMQANFKEGKFTEGLCQGIIKAGEQLKTHFPYSKDDINELSDDISFGKD